MSPFDPFGVGMFGGIKVIESPDRPRYVLPAEIIPGVPWPPGFRDEINAWSLAFLGAYNLVPRGTAYMIAGQYAVMRPQDVVKLSNIAC
jgi:hypothetical protein